MTWSIGCSSSFTYNYGEQKFRKDIRLHVAFFCLYLIYMYDWFVCIHVSVQVSCGTRWGCWMDFQQLRDIWLHVTLWVLRSKPKFPVRRASALNTNPSLWPQYMSFLYLPFFSLKSDFFLKNFWIVLPYWHRLCLLNSRYHFQIIGL